MKFDASIYCVGESESISTALRAIDDNKRGLVFTVDSSRRVTGLLTDGDIRRSLLDGNDLSAKTGDIANKNFVFAAATTPREDVLKLLDNRVKTIPVIEDGRLVDLISRDYFPPKREQATEIRSRAPVRISFGGGGSDVTHFFESQKGVVLNAAISLYAHAYLRLRDDKKIIIRSGDINSELVAANLAEALDISSDLGLLQAVISVVQPNFGFELDVYSDFGVGSGLGGSSSVLVAVLGCFNALRADQWTRYEISELAFQAERLFLGIAGGWQDQYAAAFGGVNFMEFSALKNTVTPIALSDHTVDELEERLILCDTGLDHRSGDIHTDQKSEMAKTEKRDLVTQNVALTVRMKEALISGNLSDIGQMMNDGWKIKRQLSSLITSPHIDSIYNSTISAGALGGKLLGAGGGGYFLFFTNIDQKLDVRKHLNNSGLKVTRFQIDRRGLVTWRARMSKGLV